jgi:hypothetical protein
MPVKQGRFVMGNEARRIWLERIIVGDPDKAMQLRGTRGHEFVVVQIDPSVFQLWPVNDRHTNLLAIHRAIERAAEMNFDRGLAAPVHEYYGPLFLHHLIAITREDLTEIEAQESR